MEMCFHFSAYKKIKSNSYYHGNVYSMEYDPSTKSNIYKIMRYHFVSYHQFTIYLHSLDNILNRYITNKISF